MQRAENRIERLFIGHNASALTLRLDLREKLAGCDVAIYLCGPLCGPVNQRPRERYVDPNQAPAGLALGWEIGLRQGQSEPFLFRAAGQETWVSVSPVACARGERVLEVSVPLAALGLALGDEVRVLATLAQEGVIVAEVPEREMGRAALRRFDRV